MSVFVLGHRGMLGHTVQRYLTEQGHKVSTSDLRYTGASDDPLVAAVRASGCRWVVNGIGLIKQKSTHPGDLLLVNARLPAQLKVQLSPDQCVIHPSTDCVFSGRQGKYAATQFPDATDDYGYSKLLGEAPAQLGRFQVLRGSIIGPERAGGHGLMGWFLRQTGPVRGFTNHFWNGITTLEWAKICAEIISGRWIPHQPLLQVGTKDPVSKHDLLRMISSTWGLNTWIEPFEPPEAVDRTLVPELIRNSLGDQLMELRVWHDAANAGLPES